MQEIAYPKNRRSRFDQHGRDYKCQVCDKTYLSHPALWQHMRNKHPIHQENRPITKGRGRPRKYVNAQSQVKSNPDELCAKDESCEATKTKVADPCSDKWFETTSERKGESCPIKGFPEAFNRLNMLSGTLLSHLDSGLYKALHSLNQKPKPESELTEEAKQQLPADDVLALYLLSLRTKANQDFMHTVLQVTLLYRECYNRYGWQKLAEAELGNSQDSQQQIDDERIEEKMRNYPTGKEFTGLQSAEYMPEVCNEFVSVFLPEQSQRHSVPLNTCVDLVRNLCSWLF